MKRLALFLIALAPALHFGCGLDKVIDEAESNLSKLGDSLVNFEARGGATQSAGATPGGAVAGAGAGEGAAAGGAGYPVGGDSSSCGEVLACGDNCLDDACVEQCLLNSSALAFSQLEALAYCVDASGCADDVCLESVCVGELDACFGGSAGGGGSAAEPVGGEDDYYTYESYGGSG